MTKLDYVEYYINILNEMCYLTKRTTRKTRAVRNILLGCKDEYEMSRKLHSLYVSDDTIDDFIEQYGGAINA